MNGGVLVCGGGVVILRKVGNKIGIEGALCDEYFKIRSLLYGKFQIL